jgi:zinc D-Ala-D-Ala carboxypeptidase
MSIKSKLLALVVLGVVVATGFSVWQNRPADPSPTSNTKRSSQTPAPTFDKTKYSTSQPGSIWWVVNKKRPLPDDYKPKDLVVPAVPLRLKRTAEQMHLRSDPAKALEGLVAGAKKAGFNLYLASGFRSAAYQKQLYDSYVAKDGQAAADKYSARPGTSEHQTGLAVDVGRPDQKCELEICFGDTPEGAWVKAHAHEYGFVIRYEQGKEDITTYQYEPWHLRYVGAELAAELRDTGQTMEEFFGL